jgi:hypothetical protein
LDDGIEVENGSGILFYLVFATAFPALFTDFGAHAAEYFLVSIYSCADSPRRQRAGQMQPPRKQSLRVGSYCRDPKLSGRDFLKASSLNKSLAVLVPNQFALRKGEGQYRDLRGSAACMQIPRQARPLDCQNPEFRNVEIQITHYDNNIVSHFILDHRCRSTRQCLRFRSLHSI